MYAIRSYYAMKKKDLINKIQSTALDEMPDVFDKINLDNIVIEEDYNETYRNPFNLRKAFTYTFASLFILISGVLLFNQ